MHLPDGLLSTPACVATTAAAAATIGYSLYRIQRSATDRLVPLMAITSATIFAAQMVNYPVLNGVSGHLVGGVLAAVVLGPWGGMLAISLVLAVQCFFFGDGGMAALGANILNMAVGGSLLAYVPYAMIRRNIEGAKSQVIGATIAAWLAVQIGAAMCAFELWASGRFPLQSVFASMLSVHAVIGLVEAAMTGLTVAILLRVRPETLYAPSLAQAPVGWRRVTVPYAVGALLIAVCLAPLASELPDGLEHVITSLGAADAIASIGTFDMAPWSDYRVAALGDYWFATSVAGLIGTTLVLSFGYACARLLLWRHFKTATRQRLRVGS